MAKSRPSASSRPLLSPGLGLAAWGRGEGTRAGWGLGAGSRGAPGAPSFTARRRGWRPAGAPSFPPGALGPSVPSVFSPPLPSAAGVPARKLEAK